MKSDLRASLTPTGWATSVNSYLGRIEIFNGVMQPGMKNLLEP